jgi:hypothetical protein
MLVDGKPFYPIGTYRDPSDRNDDFTGITHAGFNITHSYDFEGKDATIEQARAYLDAAQAAGVKVFMGIPRHLFFAREWNAIQKWVAALMDHPALLVWYLMDEPEAPKWRLNPAMLRQLIRFIPRRWFTSNLNKETTGQSLILRISPGMIPIRSEPIAS